MDKKDRPAHNPILSFFEQFHEPERKPSELLRLARNAFETGHYTQCVEWLDRALDLTALGAPAPQFSTLEAYRWRGRALLGLGEWEAAVQDLRRVLEQQPDIAANYSDLADAYTGGQDWDHALRTLNEGIARLEGRQAAILYRRRGRLVAAAGKLTAAIDDFSIAIYFQPREPENWLRRSLTYATLGDYRSAMRDCREAQHLAPTDYRVHYVRAQIFFHFGRYRLVLDPLARAIELQPAAAAPVGLLGRLLLAQRQPKQALPFLQKAVDMGDCRQATLQALALAQRTQQLPSPENPKLLR